MFLRFSEVLHPGRVELLLAAFPESLGILLAGVVLTSAAVVTRRLMGRSKHADKGDKGIN